MSATLQTIDSATGGPCLPQPPALELRDVRKRYTHLSSAALDGVSLSLQPGHAVALVGSSGSGKTTLLNIAAGLDRPGSGQVLLAGQDLAGMSESQLARLRRRHLGFVFQTLNLLPTLSVEQNIELPLALVGLPRSQRRSRVSGLLATAALADRRSAMPDELSLGQQQRVAVLQAVAHRPAVVLMDEPTSAMDSASAASLMRLVLDLAKDGSHAVLVATHDTNVARMFPWAIHLADGKIAKMRGGEE